MDGTPAGWVVVLCGDTLEGARGLFVSALEELPRDLEVVAIDVPIGLPERGQREADRLARQRLGEPRRRSVFPCPVRAVLGARSREEACARAVPIDGRRISRQAFGILPKIAQADAFVRSDVWARRALREVHPELSFARWAGAPMAHGKKSQAGRAERRRLIDDGFGPDAFEAVRSSVRGNHVGVDDVADAFAAAWTASRIRAGKAEAFPEERIVDAAGVPMQIWA